MANEKQIDKICRMLDDLITKSKRDTNSEPIKEQLKSPDFYEGYKIGFESAQPKWISVEERLPEPYKKVLTIRKGFSEAGRYIYSLDSTTLWIDNTPVWNGDLKTWKNRVTHWMPLPEAPKEE